MFTGIIEQTGTITAMQKASGLTTLTIKAPKIAKKLKKGGSVAIDGTCLTVTKPGPTSFLVQVIPETIKRTIIHTYRQGTSVNLELPLKANAPLDGHFVQGHIDATASIIQTKKAGDSTVLRIAIPPKLKKYIALKGSIAINGVSLTISAVSKTSKADKAAPWLEVSLIPETLAHTNLQSLKPKSPVNLEVDLIARYLESLF